MNVTVIKRVHHVISNKVLVSMILLEDSHTYVARNVRVTGTI